MPKMIKDDELRAYQQMIGAKEYKRQYHALYSEASRLSNKRYSEKEYKNTPDKLKALKEKYKNGATDKTIREMVDNLIR